MVQITVNDDLARAISQAGAVCQLSILSGQAVAHVTPVDPMSRPPSGMTPKHLAEIERRMAEDDGTRYSWPEVIEHLRVAGP